MDITSQMWKVPNLKNDLKLNQKCQKLEKFSTETYNTAFAFWTKGTGTMDTAVLV